MSYSLRIAHLYPEQMNIYGDRGNIITWQQRCRWRGIAAEVVSLRPGDSIDWGSIDLAFFGGGQDSGQALIAEDFCTRQAPELRGAIDDGLVLLAICGGYQLLGEYFLTQSGERIPCAGLLDLHTLGGSQRLIGNIVVEATLPDASPMRLVGFENHSGRTYLGPALRPLGRVLSGHGNNGEDGSEGVAYRNIFGCYMHGSLLPKNPDFADHLLELALRRRYGPLSELQPLNDQIEQRARRSMLSRLI